MTNKSTEEKAKAYDNIIEKAKKMHSENCEACQMCIEELIPELKESEDEKIRKELIETIHLAYDCGCSLNKEQRDKYLDWIEKQEYKSVELSDENVLNAIMNSLNEEKLKRVWGITYENIKNYFRTLKDRIKPEQGWSEEDEGFLNLLLAIFTNEHPDGVFTTNGITVFKGNCVTSNKIIAWLLSFKDRYIWKPSNKQIEALEIILYSYIPRDDERYSVLSEFVAELKKLKG